MAPGRPKKRPRNISGLRNQPCHIPNASESDSEDPISDGRRKSLTPAIVNNVADDDEPLRSILRISSRNKHTRGRNQNDLTSDSESNRSLGHPHKNELGRSFVTTRSGPRAHEVTEDRLSPTHRCLSWPQARALNDLKVLGGVTGGEST